MVISITSINGAADYDRDWCAEMSFPTNRDKRENLWLPILQIDVFYLLKGKSDEIYFSSSFHIWVINSRRYLLIFYHLKIIAHLIDDFDYPALDPAISVYYKRVLVKGAFIMVSAECEMVNLKANLGRCRDSY